VAQPDLLSAEFAPWRLAPFEPRHAESVIGIVAAAYAEHGQVIELDTLDDDLPHVPERYPPPASVFRVLLDGERVLGSVAVKGHGPREAELKRVFLRPECRGRGVGKRMVLWAFDWARARGYETLHIWSDVNYRVSHALYRRLGAEDTGETRFLGGRNDVLEFHFRKRL
jgi:GNAT superfamily N-acetyltransferase